jgi:hypothetical protein
MRWPVIVDSLRNLLILKYLIGFEPTIMDFIENLKSHTSLISLEISHYVGNVFLFINYNHL